ncbi:MAG: shikimate dehydrogenase [Rhodospirillales bacterium 69-11]|nr:shikimate dehydrogenase [Rhodospirillales bacterium]OJW25992.1 MAG: shikimate dehydrogenase [Rhodospirillales bacterium 69-11]
MRLTASTAIVGIVGTPIMQVKSPTVMNAWFDQQGRDAALVPIDLAPEAIAAFLPVLRGWRNLRGMIVTVPYKQVLAPLCDRLTRRAERLGTVNVIRRDPDGTLVGEILDGAGFITAAAAHGFDPRGRRAAVIGAGGVASAIADALCEAGLTELALQDVDAAKQARLAETLRTAFPRVAVREGIVDLADLDLLVNGTPVGMNGDPSLPLAAALLVGLPAGCLVADVVTAPLETPFLRQAQASGCRVQTGIEMTEAQMLQLAGWMGVGEAPA